MNTATTVLFTPIGLNLAEVTRMVEVARALRNHPSMRPVFLVHDKGFDHLVSQAGFPRLPGATPFTQEQSRQVVAFDQGRTLRHPFTLERVRERVEVERAAIRESGAAAVVHGTNPTTPISARAERVPLFYPVPYAFSAAHLASGRGLPVLPPHGPGRLLNKAIASLAARLVENAPLLPSPPFAASGRRTTCGCAAWRTCSAQTTSCSPPCPTRWAVPRCPTGTIAWGPSLPSWTFRCQASSMNWRPGSAPSSTAPSAPPEAQSWPTWPCGRWVRRLSR